MPDQIKPVYSGEAMLLRWGDNHRGRSVTLELDADAAEHPFKGLKCGENGQRMQLVAVLIDESEQPMNPPTSAKPTAVPQVGTVTREVQETKPKKEYTRSQIAALKCRDPEFQKWLDDTYGRLRALGGGRLEGSPEEIARAHLLQIIGLESRSQLDDDPAKAEAWDKLETSFRFRDQVRS